MSFSLSGSFPFIESPTSPEQHGPQDALRPPEPEAGAPAVTIAAFDPIPMPMIAREARVAPKP